MAAGGPLGGASTLEGQKPQFASRVLKTPKTGRNGNL